MKLIFGTSKWEMWDDPLELVAFINGHTGRDIFDFQENVQIFQRLTELSANSGIPILVETHRGRPTYSAIETGKYLEALPELRLTADFSHWIVVHKSGLEDQQANLELAISRADYVHARVGYAEGAINLQNIISLIITVRSLLFPRFLLPSNARDCPRNNGDQTSLTIWLPTSRRTYGIIDRFLNSRNNSMLTKRAGRGQPSGPLQGTRQSQSPHGYSLIHQA